jgi:hypothetical protein
MKPSKAFSSRLAAARQFRREMEPVLKEVAAFCEPGLELNFTPTSRPPKDVETEVFTGLAEDLASDLAADIISYYTPSEVTWAEYQVTVPVPENKVADVEALVGAREKDLADIFLASNYYDIAPQWGFAAASHGTPALWVDSAHIAQPVFFEVLPCNEVLIVPGHLGHLDRFRETVVPSNTIPTLLATWNPDLSDVSLKNKIDKENTFCTVIWGFWLDWADQGNPQWLCEITVDGKRVTPEGVKIGPMAGSCPMLVGRFNPKPRRPWGRGPAIKALPDLRVLDKVNDVVLSGLDQSISTTLIYADDGMLDLSQGIVAGTANAAHRGFTREQIYDLSRSVNVDQGWYSADRLEASIRTTFYQDGPRQRGETPPTAAQWMDERRRVQQRLGKPSAPLWTELIYPMIQRVEYLAIKAGKLQEAIALNGEAITITPISPLQKAQNQDKVMIARSNLDMAVGILGEGAGQVIDMAATMKNMIGASGDEITVIAKEQNAPAPAPV